MSVVVGLISDGRVWMGADSSVIPSGWSITESATPKLFEWGWMIIGGVGRIAMIQKIKHGLPSPPVLAVLKDVEKYLQNGFVQLVKECLDDDKLPEDGSLLIGAAGRIYTMTKDCGVYASFDPYDAIGGGRDLALGSLGTTALYWSDAPEKRIKKALELAEKHNASVRRPWDILSV